MRGWWRIAMAGALACLSATTTNAATVLTVTGTITRLAALRDSAPTAIPPSRIAIGDTFSLTAAFDRSRAQLTALFDADPAVNIYYLPGTTATVTIGSFSRTFTPSDISSSIQIWNDRDSAGPVDSQSFNFFDYNVQPASLLPFDLGAGMQSGSSSFNAFDFSATARTDDLIAQLAPLSDFGSKSFSFGQLNSTTNLYALAEGNVTSATLVERIVGPVASSAPEPDAWGLMILGFGVSGAALRRRRRHARGRPRQAA